MEGLSCLGYEHFSTHPHTNIQIVRNNVTNQYVNVCVKFYTHFSRACRGTWRMVYMYFKKYVYVYTCVANWCNAYVYVCVCDMYVCQKMWTNQVSIKRLNDVTALLQRHSLHTIHCKQVSKVGHFEGGSSQTNWHRTERQRVRDIWNQPAELS